MRAFLPFLSATICFLSAIPLSAQSDWFETLTEERMKKNEELLSGDKSPLPDSVKKQFTGLNYFPPDKKFAVTADFIRLKKPTKVIFQTSDGRERIYFRCAALQFRLNEKNFRLYVYYNEDIRKNPGLEDYLFLPFKDLTNGKGTYGGGRYLELREPEGDFIVLDFNRAFNPYCAYSDRYSCPKIPEENYLPLKIEAGEKVLYGE
jgi:uncharacterized protein (DUF1684 family)